MAKNQFDMSPERIAKVLGTVGSPLIVISELLKNAVDVSAQNIDIYYDTEQHSIVVENDHKGFSIEEIKKLYTPGVSAKKENGNLKNENAMFFTGSKGLGLLSVFSLCDEAEILTTPIDKKTHKIILNKANGTVEDSIINQPFQKYFTKITLKNVAPKNIDFLSSESETGKLRHICTYLYKHDKVPFPVMTLHIYGQQPKQINFSCDFSPMLYDVYFDFDKNTGKLNFKCLDKGKTITSKTITFEKFDLEDLQGVMAKCYNIKNTISTRTNEDMFSNFDEVPSFEGRMLVYEGKTVNSELKGYGAGVDIYINDFALYNYLAEENDWLGLADFSQRKKATRVKPHNVFGYVNFPNFDENTEHLQISNERADFIQDITFSKLMYLLKGVVMFAVFNIDLVAHKNRKCKGKADSDLENGQNTFGNDAADNSVSTSDDTYTKQDKKTDDEVRDKHSTERKNAQIMADTYLSQSTYKPSPNLHQHLEFTEREGIVITKLKGVDNLSDKIYNLIFELTKLNFKDHRYANACLYRTLIDSATKYLSKNQKSVSYDGHKLESSVQSALSYFSNSRGKDSRISISPNEIDAWRTVAIKSKLITILNGYIHNETPVDLNLLQQSWNTMKGYIIACLTIK